MDIKIDPLLKEYSYGHWEGLTLDEVKENRTSEWNERIADKWNYTVPGGESYAILTSRAKSWLMKQQESRCVVAVSHQMIGRAIRGAYLGLDSESTMALTQENNEVIVLKDGFETKVAA